MKRYSKPNINTPKYWDEHQTALDFGLRQKKYLKLAEKGTRIAEIGCGLSPFLSEARYYFALAVGVDFSEETIKKAQKLYPNVLYCNFNANNLSEIDSTFDVVVAGEIIEHLEDPDKFLKDLEKITTRRVILSTPILEFDDPEHLWEFDEEYFKRNGFKTEVVESNRFRGRKYIFAWKDL